MNRFTSILAAFLVVGTYPSFADDKSLEDELAFMLAESQRGVNPIKQSLFNFFNPYTEQLTPEDQARLSQHWRRRKEEAVKPRWDMHAQTQGAGTPNAIGVGAFVPLHTTSNAVTYIDVEAKANLDDRSGDSSIINTDVAGTTLSTSTRLGYRWLNDVGDWMYGVYGGYDTRELGTGSADTGVTVTNSKTVHFQQVAVGAEAVSNQWSLHAYALIPTGTTEKQINSHYQAGALDTVGVDAGYQINDKTKATVGYYHQNGDLGEADGSGASAALAYDITDNLTAGIKVTYDDAFETRVMATINWSFGNLTQGNEAEKEVGLNWLMNALSASPEQRDVRVHDGRA
jgi:hypothetical protein|tara:strand:- start:181 stop:1209 length:1029 start_codon:yes stop_codon:yes gene_type:complete